MTTRFNSLKCSSESKQKLTLVIGSEKRVNPCAVFVPLLHHFFITTKSERPTKLDSWFKVDPCYDTTQLVDTLLQHHCTSTLPLSTSRKKGRRPKLTFLTSKSVAVRAVDIIPFIVMIFKKTQSMYTILIGKVVWLEFCPVMEVSGCSIGPYKLSFCVDIRKAQPRLFSSVQTLNEHIFFLTVYTGKISSLYRTCSLTEAPWTAGCNFSVAISSEVEPVFLANICSRKKNKYHWFVWPIH